MPIGCLQDTEMETFMESKLDIVGGKWYAVSMESGLSIGRRSS